MQVVQCIFMPSLHVIIMNKKYDYIILGGGCSGLSLAYHLNIANRLNNKTLCIVEKRKDYKETKYGRFGILKILNLTIAN